MTTATVTPEAQDPSTPPEGVNPSEPGQVHFSEPPKSPEPPVEVTHETMGVSEAQFTKYFNKDTGEYNWAAHQKEVEYRARGGKPEDAQAPNPADVKPADVKPEDVKPEDIKPDAPEGDDTAKTAAEEAGLNFDELSDQVVKEGKLTDEQLAAFAKIGIPQEVVEQYISGLALSAEQYTADITEAFGGDEVLASVQDWCSKNITNEEAEGWNKLLADPTTMKQAAAALSAKAQADDNFRLNQAPTREVTAPNQQGGDDSNAAKPFGSIQEQTLAMRDPRYKADPAFRAEVAARVAATDAFMANPRSHNGGL